MEWHVWTITQNRYTKLSQFLNKLDGMDECLYPTVLREYMTKSGMKTKNIPLYSNYIFLKYKYTNEFVINLKKCPWIKRYVGTCNDAEIKRVKDLSKQKYEDIIPTTGVIVGHSYKLKATPFKGMRCIVVDVDENKLLVSVTIFGAERIIKCLIDDIDIEG